MKQVFLDTNIVLDLLARRVPYYHEAAALFSLADREVIKLSLSSLSLANTHYIIAKIKSDKNIKLIFEYLKKFNDPQKDTKKLSKRKRIGFKPDM